MYTIHVYINETQVRASCHHFLSRTYKTELSRMRIIRFLQNKRYVGVFNLYMTIKHGNVHTYACQVYMACHSSEKPAGNQHGEC